MNSLSVRVASASKTFFDGEARSVSSISSIGPFDILVDHENFISLIRDKVTIFDQGGKRYEIEIEKGILEVSENKVRVFTGI